MLPIFIKKLICIEDQSKVSDLQKLLTDVIRKIALATIKGFKGLLKWLDEGSKIHHRVQLSKDEWRYNNPYCIRGLY